MVGISLGSLQKFGRWVGGLSGPTRAAGALAIVVLIAAAAWGVMVSNAQANLLRTDPDLASADPAMMKFSVGRGRAVFNHDCAVCHGANGKGDVAKGVPDLTDNDWLYGVGAASDIETTVLYGIRAPNPKTWRLADMPAFAQKVPYAREPLIQPLTPADINDVIAFLGSQSGKTVDPEAATRGGVIFSNRGGCYDCHGDGHGDSAIGGPNLVDNVWLFGGSQKQQFDSIAYGRAGFCPAWVARLKPGKIREVVLYVYSLSHQSPAKGPSAQ